MSRMLDVARVIKYLTKKNYFFSQTGEEILIGPYLDKSPGRYLDVGAHHPIIGSNTFLLYRNGWSGFVFEPQKQFNLLWRLFRSRDTLINNPVGMKDKVIFNSFSNSLLSTSNSDAAEIFQQQNTILNQEEMDTVKLRDFLPPILSSEDNFALSIDVEGSEIEVLDSIDWEHQKPRVVLLESWDKPWGKQNQLNNYMESRNYQLEAYTGLTAIYVCTLFIGLHPAKHTRIAKELDRRRNE